MSFKFAVTIRPHPDGIHCGSCSFSRSDGFKGLCYLFTEFAGEHCECPYDPDWKHIKRCQKCINAEKDSI